MIFLQLQELLFNLTEVQFVVLCFTCVFTVILLIFLGFFIGKIYAKLKAKSEIEEARKDAVKRSRAILNGQLSEQFAAFLPGFPGNANDAHFLGKPVDFICFTGLNESDEVKEILFIEVKSGTATLSKRERAVKEAVENKKVRYVTYNTPL